MSETPPFSFTTWLGAFVSRFAAMMLVWAVLTEFSGYQLWFGLALTAAAAGLSLALAPPLGHWLSPVAVLRLLPFFLQQALLGGIDVGLRAVRRRPLQPTFVEYRLAPNSAAGRLWLACMVSLVPGTVACELRDDALHIHVLDRSMDVEPVVRKLESHITAIFRITSG